MQDVHILMRVIKTGFIMMIYTSFEIFLKQGTRFVFLSQLLAYEKKNEIQFVCFFVSSKIRVSGSENTVLKERKKVIKTWLKQLVHPFCY